MVRSGNQLHPPTLSCWSKLSQCSILNPVSSKYREQTRVRRGRNGTEVDGQIDSSSLFTERPDARRPLLLLAFGPSFSLTLGFLFPLALTLWLYKSRLGESGSTGEMRLI